MANLVWCSSARAADVQDLFPDNNVSWQPFVEFRARGPGGIGHAGHAFVELGFEGDNGNRYYEVVAGFYPDIASNKENIVKIIQGTKGHLAYHYEDLHDDVNFRVNITHDQAYSVLFVLQQWDSKQYKLPSENCVSMVTAVARVLDLKVPTGFDKVEHASLLWPVPFVQYLAQHNAVDQKSPATARANAQRDAQWDHMAHVMREQDEAQRKYNRRAEAARAAQQPTVQIPIPNTPEWKAYMEQLHK